MTHAIQNRRGTTAQANAETLLQGELYMDTDTKQLRIHDGAMVGGQIVATPLNTFALSLLATATATAARGVLVAAQSGPNSDITSISGLTTPLSAAQGGTGNTTGLAATATALAVSRSISTTGDAAWTVNFNGTANVTAALTLASVGTAGTYGTVTTDAKGRVTSGAIVTPVVNGGTGQSTVAAHLADLVTAGAYSKTSVLGTVSQASGIPTGAVIERGSNANGEYVKYADGTMICTFYVASVSVAITNAYGVVFYGLPALWTFPVAFVGNFPAVTLTAYRPGGLVWTTRGGASSLTSAQMAILDISSNTNNVQLSYTSIGRWF